MQKKREPRGTSRVSYASSRISTAAPPTTSVGASAAMSRSSCIWPTKSSSGLSGCSVYPRETGSHRSRPPTAYGGTCDVSGAETWRLCVVGAARGSAGRGVRRDFEILQVEACDLLEGRRGDDAAPDRALGLVHGHEDDEPRPRGRD